MYFEIHVDTQTPTYFAVNTKVNAYPFSKLNNLSFVTECGFLIHSTWGDRKIRVKMFSFLSLLLFRDEISSNNATIYMQLFSCNNACIIRTLALQLSLWKHRLTLCGAT